MDMAPNDPFANLDSSFLQAQIAMAALDEVLIPIPARADKLNKMTALYIMSAGARAKGLHAGIVRECGWDNPHAVFVLLRALVDLAMVTMEVRRNPDYVYAIAHDPAKSAKGRRKKSPQALIAAGLKEMPDLKNAWNPLRDGSALRLGSLPDGALKIERTDEGTTITASTGPGWSDPEMKLASMRHTCELTRSIAGMLRAIADG